MKTKLMATIMITLFLVSVTAFAIPVKAGTVWHVYPGLGTPIQNAVNSASPGDRILVHAGVYPESVSVSKSLNIKAQGAVKVNPTPTGFTNGFYVISNGVTIEGFEIADTNFGIWFEGSYNTFSHNYIHDIYSTVNWYDGGVGISLWDMNGGSNYNEIAFNVIENIERTGILLDIAWTDGGAGINTGNSIHHNEISQTPWGAIEVLNADYTAIHHNTISDCGDWGIALLNAEAGINSNYNTIAHNKISGAHGSWGVGILLYAWAGCAEQNIIHHNSISHIDGLEVGVWIMANYNTIHHNFVDGITVDNPYWDSGIGNSDFKNSWN
jgi:hypothetical protein